jgi:ABC-type transport system involved in multi-copper enzyme maturation permease subunit
MKNIWILSGITVKEGIRNRVLVGILFFAIVMCGVNFVVTNSFTRDLGKVAVDVGLSTVSISGLAIIFFLGMPLLAKDLDKLTVYLILSRPVSRREYILGKFFGMSALVAISVLILSFITAITVKLIMSTVPTYIPVFFSWKTFGAAVFFSFLSLLIITALSILFTCFSTSPYMSYVFTIGSYLIGQNVEMVREMMRNLHPDVRMTTGILDVASWIFPNLSLFDRKTVAAYGLALHPREIGMTTLYGVSYIMIVLILSIIVFNRRELT